MPKAEKSLNELLHEIRRIEEHRTGLTEKEIRKIYKNLVRDLTAFIGEVYTKYADKNGELTLTILHEKAKYAWFIKEIEKNCNKHLSISTKKVEELVEKVYEKCYNGMIKTVKNASDEALKDVPVNSYVLKQSMNNDIEKLTLPNVLEKHRHEIVYEIKKTLNIGLMNGERYEPMIRQLIDRLDFSYNKCNNIVRTEAHRNVEKGFSDCAAKISDGLEGSDLVYVKTWRTMKDERVRPQQRYKTKSGWKTRISRNGANHIKLEGATVKARDKFKVEPGVYAECPGMSGTARNDCRCRCFAEYDLITKKEYDLRKSQKVGLQENTNKLNSELREKMNKLGIVDMQLERTTDANRFNDAILAAKKSNANGACVDTHPLEELKTYKLILAKDNMAGVAVKPDGDITAVFKNSTSKAKGAVNDLIITARANGGDKMDCYGKFLVNAYEKCGYVPVARIPFNADYVDDKFLLDNPMDVYALMKNTDSLETVVKKNANKLYTTSTQEKLDNLPTFEDYDEALKYRDNLLKSQK